MRFNAVEDTGDASFDSVACYSVGSDSEATLFLDSVEMVLVTEVTITDFAKSNAEERFIVIPLRDGQVTVK